MRAQRPNAQEREKLRRQRSETRLVVARCNELGFEYVCNPPVWPTVGFLRKIRRGPDDEFVRDSFTMEWPTPGPANYDVSNPIGFQYPSKAGFSALANKMPRLPAFREQGYPPIGSYATDFPGTQYYFSFSRQIRPMDRVAKWVTPGPSTYTHHLKYPGWDVEMAFGSRRIIWPSVAVFCSPLNNAKCSVCGEKPVGDYFHNFGSDADMCRKCMHMEVGAIKKCSLQVTERFLRQQKIKQFVPARYCGFFHIHDGTTATIERDSRKVLRQKINVENYLYRMSAKID
ncbi:hypothetical protein KR009_012219 [Drosophila setifemur]|nr:hypothetical protein KR009_012219 [Drosophila setifemur]